ncbi:hypothetical protein IMZ48_20325 [Candidatus Bathyarchaeota archaeon]|nr:hypothetical protein [Candidatus Bathyarchaeota archaeon]
MQPRLPSLRRDVLLFMWDSNSREQLSRGFLRGLEATVEVTTGRKDATDELVCFRHGAESMALLVFHYDTAERDPSESRGLGAKVAAALAMDKKRSVHPKWLREGAEAIISLVSYDKVDYSGHLEDFCWGAESTMGLINRSSTPNTTCTL